MEWDDRCRNDFLRKPVDLHEAEPPYRIEIVLAAM